MVGRYQIATTAHTPCYQHNLDGQPIPLILCHYSADCQSSQKSVRVHGETVLFVPTISGMVGLLQRMTHIRSSDSLAFRVTILWPTDP